jgi:hypothetical protein
MAVREAAHCHAIAILEKEKWAEHPWCEMVGFLRFGAGVGWEMCRILLSLFCFFGTIASGSGARAGFFTGNELYAICTSANNSDRSECLGYVVGIADAGAYNPIVSKGYYTGWGSSIGQARWCLPEGVVVTQIRDVVLNYLRDKPQFRNSGAAGLAAFALETAWPCER